MAMKDGIDVEYLLQALYLRECLSLSSRWFMTWQCSDLYQRQLQMFTNQKVQAQPGRALTTACCSLAVQKVPLR